MTLDTRAGGLSGSSMKTESKLELDSVSILIIFQTT